MEIRNIPIGEVKPSPMNPRKTFDEAALTELADNIRQQGLLQPIKVRPVKATGESAKYEIVYGERRYRAMKALNAEDQERWPTIPAIVRDMTDEEAFDEMITENLQRKDVDPIEEAFAFGQLIVKGHTAEEVAVRFGKSVRFVQDRVKLNNLIPELLLKVREGKMALVAAMIIAKFDDETQRKFFSAYGNYETIGKDAAQRFVDNQFMLLRRASWCQSNNEADRDFEGGCGCKCAECPYNTANANCLFWEMKANADDGKCSYRPGFEAKHIAYLLAYLERQNDKIVRRGEALGYGKTVIVDAANCWNDEARRIHNEVLKALATKDYEIVKPSEIFASQVYYPEGDERIDSKLKDGELYRCIDVMNYASLPSPRIVYYYLKPQVKNVGTLKGEVAPTEVVSLVAKHRRNIDDANESANKRRAELASSMGPSKRRGALCEEEQIALDMLILHALSVEFFRAHYNSCTSGMRPSVQELREIAINNTADRDMWCREYIRINMATSSYPDSLNAAVRMDILPLWSREEYDAIERKALSGLKKKNDKIMARLDELGYDVLGGRLPSDKQPNGSTSPALKTSYDETKRRHPDALLLFRVGDFFEALEEDAEACADILGLTLAKRRDGKDVVRICGFPHHALDGYLPKLIRAGKRVAICENLKQS